LRSAIVGKQVRRVRALHAAHRRRLPAGAARRVTGLVIANVERRGKHQLVRFSSGAALHVHFRMAGDWEVGRVGDPLSPYARVVIELDDETRVSLVDPRALSTVTFHMAGDDPLPALGPDASDPSVSAAELFAALSRRRAPIKTVLLDQRILAGVGNIYAAEALWLARIDPRRSASSLDQGEAKRLLRAVRQVLERAQRRPATYTSAAASRFTVYDREGERCRRCGSAIARIVQAGRSTYYCPGCQA
jgi:formamidopyrimidine-DNA glycosylase